MPELDEPVWERLRGICTEIEHTFVQPSGMPTAEQIPVIAVVRNLTATKGRPPSVREVGFAMGWRSSSTAHKYISHLVYRGYLTRDARVSRSLQVVGDPDPQRLKQMLTHVLDEFHQILALR